MQIYLLCGITVMNDLFFVWLFFSGKWHKEKLHESESKLALDTSNVRSKLWNAFFDRLKNIDWPLRKSVICAQSILTIVATTEAFQCLFFGSTRLETAGLTAP